MDSAIIACVLVKFIKKPRLFLSNKNVMFEREPIQRLIKEQEVSVYKHFGFWKCMDNIRDKNALTEIWESGLAPWK